MRVPDPHGRKGAEEDEDKDSIRDGLWGTGEEGVGCGEELQRWRKVRGGSEIHQKFAVMDQKTVWYGSINLLSYGSSQESIMRIESSNIANELIKSVERPHD